MKTTKVGIVGCGMISDTYFKASQKFKMIEVVACSDIIPERSLAKHELYGVQNMTNDELFAIPDLDIVLNLTPPQVHSKIAIDALNAGKNEYSEKPFGVDSEDAAKVMALAAAKNLRVGCAPDTFLGAGQQTARKLLDDGWIGKPIAGTAMFMGRGPEKWPQAPFFYDYGAGPMLDLGPYLVTSLVNLLGPAKAVTATTIKGAETRTGGPDTIPHVYPVNVTTHLAGNVEFACGTVITIISSFEVYKQSHPIMELYGTEGSMSIPDPNTFDGPVKVFREGAADWQECPLSHSYVGNNRSIGVADMAIAMQNNRPHRANGTLANHVLDIMLAFDKSSKLGHRYELTTTCERPKPLPLGLEIGEIDP